MGDHSALFQEIRNFRHKGLRPVETTVVNAAGEQLIEKRTAKGLQVIAANGTKGPGYVVDHKPDLQVGMIIPGLLIASQDVAADKALLEQYGITHILNLAYGVANSFEDDFNYKKLDILDTPETDITQYFEECFDFIDEAIQRGNCLVHCNAGVSRSTAICCAYIMKKQKIRYPEALALVREARAFARPNDGFAKQLESWSDQLLGQFDAPDASEDAFVAKKKAEREAERARIAGQVSIKNRLREFGAQLSKVYEGKLECMSAIKLPLKKNAPSRKTPSTPSRNSAQAPPPPPPPPSSSNNQGPPPPPPPPGSNKSAPPPPPPAPTPIAPKPSRKSAAPPPLVDDKYNGPKSTNPNVEEESISVAAKKKLWDDTLKKTEEKTLPKVQTTPATPNVAKARFAWQQQTNQQQQPPSNRPSPSPSRSPEPVPKASGKKIIIKQRRDSNTSNGSDSEGPTRRSTRDLIEALEAASSTSNSPSASPSVIRKSTASPYGRPPSQLATESRTASPAPRKPTWGLRETVDSKEPSPAPSPAPPEPLSNRSSPSPAKQVFGRVPPRKVSLTGNAQPLPAANNELAAEFDRLERIIESLSRPSSPTADRRQLLNADLSGRQLPRSAPCSPAAKMFASRTEPPSRIHFAPARNCPSGPEETNQRDGSNSEAVTTSGRKPFPLKAPQVVVKEVTPNQAPNGSYRLEHHDVVDLPHSGSTSASSFFTNGTNPFQTLRLPGRTQQQQRQNQNRDFENAQKQLTNAIASLMNTQSSQVSGTLSPNLEPVRRAASVGSGQRFAPRRLDPSRFVTADSGSREFLPRNGPNREFVPVNRESRASSFTHLTTPPNRQQPAQWNAFQEQSQQSGRPIWARSVSPTPVPRLESTQLLSSERFLNPNAPHWTASSRSAQDLRQF